MTTNGSNGSDVGHDRPVGHAGPDRSLPNIHRVVQIATRRVRGAAALRALFFAGMVAAGLVLLLVLVARVTPALRLPPDSVLWPWIVGAAIAAVVVSTLVAYFRPRTVLEDAIDVDQRLSLRDRLSSALSLTKLDAPFAVAAVNDGEKIAGDRSLPSRVAKAFAVQWPRTWWVAPVLALGAFMAAWFMPQYDLWSRNGSGSNEDIVQANADAAREIDSVVKKIEENPLLAEALAAEIDKANTDLGEEKPQAPEEIRREALKKLSELSDKLDELINDEKAQSIEALKDQLSSMKLPEASEAAKFAEALKRGDFAKANEALKTLQKALEEGKLSPEAQEAVAKALEKMADELARSEADRKALEEALKDAGLDPALASNPEAMKNAVENSQKLTESQKEALKKAMQCQSGACQMRKELAKQMSQMASQCKGGKQGKDGKPGSCGQGVGEMLSDLEMKQAMLMQAKAAQGACKDGKSGMCQGMGSCSGAPKISHGLTNSGGIGGGFRPEMPSATKTKIQQAQGKKDDADVIAREFIEGAPIVGQSTAVFRKIEANATAAAEEGSDDDPVPPHLVGAHKHYFGELKKKLDARQVAPKPADGASDAEAPAPTKESKPGAD